MKTKEEIYNKIYNADTDFSENMSFTYAKFCANLNKFLPEINKNEYADLFNQTLYNQNISGIEQYDSRFIDNLNIINYNESDIENIANSKPTIFATFHLGPYRLLNLFLVKRGFKVVLIIDEVAFNEQGNEMYNICKKYLDQSPGSDFILLNVKDNQTIFKLKKLLQEGYVLIVYLDGNTGINDSKQDFSKGYSNIKFFNQEIFVKNGIGKIAKMLNAQIIPTIPFRDENHNGYVQFFKKIEASDCLNSNQFPEISIDYCYQKLQVSLKERIVQWECWLYIEKWFLRNNFTPFQKNTSVKNIFNDDRYLIFKVGSKGFVFDYLDYLTFPIDIDLYQKLNFEIDNIKPEILKKLIEKNIII